MRRNLQRIIQTDERIRIVGLQQIYSESRMTILKLSAAKSHLQANHWKLEKYAKQN
jgi:hypothetical protein